MFSPLCTAESRLMTADKTHISLVKRKMKKVSPI